MERIEYRREIEVRHTYDVIVAGSGPAGICAAVAAAREGAEVALVERYGVLGGCLTTGYVGPILGTVGKGTMREELCALLGVEDNDMVGERGNAHDFEKAKLTLAEFVAAEKNIDVYLQCTVADAVMEGNAVRGVVIASSDDLFALTTAVTIDSTGDAGLSAMAGAEIRKGRDGDGLMQPVTLEFTIDGVDESRALICIGDIDEVKLGDEKFLDFCARMASEGKLPEQLAAVRLHPAVKPGLRQVNTTQVCGVDITKVDQIFKADLELRRQIEVIVKFLQENVPGYEHCRRIASGTTTGVRESRRVIGDYIMTGEDVENGSKFDDAIVHDAGFLVDIHNPQGAGQAEAKIAWPKPYDLPYRCFTPKGIENFYVAGRCISGTHRAHASYRVMSICMAMGQAVGIAAATCASQGLGTREIDVVALRDNLRSKGIDL